jgi:hypothetical protein
LPSSKVCVRSIVRIPAQGSRSLFFHTSPSGKSGDILWRQLFPIL